MKFIECVYYSPSNIYECIVFIYVFVFTSCFEADDEGVGSISYILVPVQSDRKIFTR